MFAVSVLGFVFMRTPRGTFVDAVLDALMFYGVLAMVYVMGVALFQPFWLDKQVFHLQEGIWLLNWFNNITLFFIGLASFISGMVMKVKRRH
jgi:hypothetical protein